MIIGSCKISQNFSLVKYYFCIEKRIESHVPGYFCEKSDIICAKVPMEGPSRVLGVTLSTVKVLIPVQTSSDPLFRYFSYLYQLFYEFH